MPYQMNWFVDQRVVLTTFEGTLTAAELETFLLEVSQYTQCGQPLVHHISDSLALEKLDISLRTLQIMLRTFRRVPNSGWQIEVTHNPIVKMMGVFSCQFAGIQQHVQPSLDEAILFLKTNDPSLAAAVWNQPLFAPTPN